MINLPPSQSTSTPNDTSLISPSGFLSSASDRPSKHALKLVNIPPPLDLLHAQLETIDTEEHVMTARLSQFPIQLDQAPQQLSLHSPVGPRPTAGTPTQPSPANAGRFQAFLAAAAAAAQSHPGAAQSPNPIIQSPAGPNTTTHPSGAGIDLLQSHRHHHHAHHPTQWPSPSTGPEDVNIAASPSTNSAQPHHYHLPHHLQQQQPAPQQSQPQIHHQSLIHPRQPSPPHLHSIITANNSNSSSNTAGSSSPSLPLDSPLSSDLNSSCSSSRLSSSAAGHRQHRSNSYFTHNPLQLEPPPTLKQPHNSATPHPTTTDLIASDTSNVYTTMPPIGYPNPAATHLFPAYPAPPPPQLSSHQRPSLTLDYSAAAAFTPSGGSPPLSSSAASSFFHHIDGAGRRHTLSAFMSPSLELGLIGNPELDETLIKEEKRRRNKESSQRFRDRTRERQKEKQERLDHLERRNKELEAELRMARARSSGQETLAGNEERELIDALRKDNEQLRAALKRAEEEIHRLRDTEGGGTRPRQPSPHSPFNVAPIYNSITQLSPPASTGVPSSNHSSSSPAPDPNQIGNKRANSPDSDNQSTHAIHHMTGYTMKASGSAGPASYHHLANHPPNTEYCWTTE